MKLCSLFCAPTLALALAATAFAQDAAPTQPRPSLAQAPGAAGLREQRVPQGGWGGPNMAGGRGIGGVVTQVGADRYVVKTEAGETYTIRFSVNTRIMKQNIQRRGQGRPGQGEAGSEQAMPQMLKATDIKVGDTIGAMGEVDAATKSVGALVVVLVDPERAKQLRELQANFGKTWLMGKVTAIEETKVTVQSSVDNASHSFTADENTAFRKRREPITLADVQVGDMVRVEGAVKDGVFVATTVAVMGMPPGGGATVPHEGPPAGEPK